MARRTSTVIIEPHMLVREALESLIKNYRYRVVRSVGSTADISNRATVGDGPKLVILGAESADDAVAEATNIRKIWSNSKIVLLFEYASVADFQKLLTSEVDGCVPLFASPETLIKTLDLVTIEGARVVVTASSKTTSIRPSPKDRSRLPQAEPDEIPSGSIEQETRPANVLLMPPTRPIVDGYRAVRQNSQEVDAPWVSPLRNRARLSERETQILDGLVKGYANKVIARTCDITEATVKVHLKSILRKIQVANRTQAAIWALENGHVASPTKDAC